MTYAVALRLSSGIVFAADTRTNAGVDNISQYRKLHFWRRPGDRVLVLLTAGNLAVTQSVVSVLNEQLAAEETSGKPILDRVARREMRLGEAAKLILLSFDSTLRSNLSVGMPIDILVYDRDSLDVRQSRRIGENDEYFRRLSAAWSDALRTAVARMEEFKG